MTNIVQVQFKSRYRDEHSGTAYTYLADIPLAVGDIVTVPTARGDGEARVCRVDVPESECNYPLDKLRHITKPAVVGGVFDEFLNAALPRKKGEF